MESKRMGMVVTMMIVVVIGNLVNQAEAQGGIPFHICYPACLSSCRDESGFLDKVKCPYKCLKTCHEQASPESISSNRNNDDDTNYICQLGCVMDHCVTLSSLQNPNVGKVSACVDSCSNKCSNKYHN